MTHICNILDLYAKPPSYKFNKNELDIIRQHLKLQKERHKVKYAVYKHESKFGGQLAVVYDTHANSPRKSAAENSFDFICERPISDIEFEETVQNFGTNNRRFKVYYYKNIEDLINADKLYDIQTPIIFIETVKKQFKNRNYEYK